MAKKKVFVSYDYDYDHGLKSTLISQARRPDSPFSINDFSLQQSLPEETWISKAQSAISRRDAYPGEISRLFGLKTAGCSGKSATLLVALD